MSAIPDIQMSEYKARTKRIQSALASRNCDALFLTSEDNVQYLTGYRSPVWNNLTRPRYLIVPASGEPIIVSTINYVVIVEETTWIRDIRTWIAPNPDDEGISVAVDALKSCIKSHRRVAAELGQQSRLAMPAGDFLKLRNALADVDFVDGHAMLMAERVVKSPAEIARIKVAAEATSKAFGAVTQFRSSRGHHLFDRSRTEKQNSCRRCGRRSLCHRCFGERRLSLR